MSLLAEAASELSFSALVPAQAISANGNISATPFDMQPYIGKLAVFANVGNGNALTNYTLYLLASADTNIQNATNINQVNGAQASFSILNNNQAQPKLIVDARANPGKRYLFAAWNITGTSVPVGVDIVGRKQLQP